MLSNIMLCMLSLLCIWCYRQGVRDGMSAKEGKPPAPLIKPLPKPPSKEQQYFSDIERNLEAYDGTKKNQKEVPNGL